MEMKKRKSLKELFEMGKQMLAPCVYDCLSAKAMELCGFDGLLLSGGAMSYVLGVSHEEDFSADEMIRITESITRTVSIPVVVDAADGHATTPTGVYRNVRRLALAGAGGLTIDDGDGDFRTRDNLIPFKGKGGIRGPKDLNNIMEPFAQPKCMSEIWGRGFRPVIGKTEYLEKIHAAVMACEGTDCMVVARTECYDTYGFDEVVDRINGAMKLGAQMWTVCLGMWSEADGRMFSEALGGWKMWPDIVSVDRKPNVSMETLKDMGFNFVTCHIAEKAAMYGMEKFGREILNTKKTGSLDKAEIEGLTKEQVADVLGMGISYAREQNNNFFIKE
jgi:2-methylisocitrate lyase-like PEP mutase family enzyme